MTHEEFIKYAKRKVASFESVRSDISSDEAEKFDISQVFVAWSCKVLQNSKALLSMPHKKAHYYEFTMNGDKNEIYMTVYQKIVNMTI